MDRKILPYKKLKFFFDESEIEKRRLKKQTKKPQSKQKIYDCTTCPLDKSLKVKGYGKNTDYLFIARDPGREEVERGRPLIGASGILLRDGLYASGFDLDTDGHADNIVSCRPPKNKYSKLACKCCHSSLEQKLRNYKPKIIVTLGREATERILGDCNSIEAFRCIPIPSHKYNCIVFPLFHPAAILRARRKHDEEEYYKDLKIFTTLWGKVRSGEFNIPRFLNQTKVNYSIEKITDVARLEDIADVIYEQGIFALDFEGNTAKAYLEGSELWMIGLAYPFPHSEADLTKGCYIPYHENYGIFTDSERGKIEEIILSLTNSNEIIKVIQNSKHEDSYLRNFFGAELEEPIVCTMIQRHILNSRKKITSLRNQVLMAYGVTYKDKTDPKLQVQKGETFNRIYEIPVDDLGNRCALDSIYAYSLHERQNIEFNNSPGILKAYCTPFFMKGAKVFANYEERGMNIDRNLLEELDQKWKEKSESLEKTLLKMPTVIRFKKKLTGELNLNSPQQLGKLLFGKDYYSLVPIRLTELTQNPSTDAETLQILSKENYFCKILLDKRKLDNLRSTYVDNIRRYIGADGRLHPSFWLNIAETYRSCVAKGTMIDIVRDVSKFPKGIPIENVKPGDYAYCFDNNLKPVIKKVLWAGKTGIKKVIRIYWQANKLRGKKGYLDLTPEHKIRLVNGLYKEAQYLKPGDRCLSLARMRDQLYFTKNLVKKERYTRGLLEHRFIYETLIGPLKDSDIVHHKNGNHLDNRLQNLEKTDKCSHSWYHCCFNDPEVRKKNVMGIKQAWKDGRITGKFGFDNGKSLRLSKYSLLKRLANARGILTRITNDFDTIKKYCKLYNIDWNMVKLRYDKYGNYISRGRAKRLANLGVARIVKTLGINHYKIHELFRYYNIELPIIWKNQISNGVRKIANHTITKIVHLNKYVFVYDLEIEDSHNFIANGICAHNSSSEPNFQNYPKRYEVGEDLEAKEIRKVFIPSYPDWEIREVDYKGNEVKGLWMLCRDPQLLEDLNNNLDMHSYFAALLFSKHESEISSQERQRGKNEFVFATFYGASFRSIAEMMGLPEDHIQWCQNHLFSRYPGIKEWQMKVMNDYNKTGYSNLLTGFRRERPLDWTKVINTPIQGTSFHLLLNSCIEIEKLEGFQTKACGQIHDSIYFDGPIEERDRHIKAVTDIMTNLPWKWAKGIKIEVDWACGSNWMELEKVKI